MLKRQRDEGSTAMKDTNNKRTNKQQHNRKPEQQFAFCHLHIYLYIYVYCHNNDELVRCLSYVNKPLTYLQLTHKAPPTICSRRQFQILPLFQK